MSANFPTSGVTAAIAHIHGGENTINYYLLGEQNSANGYVVQRDPSASSFSSSSYYVSVGTALPMNVPTEPPRARHEYDIAKDLDTKFVDLHFASFLPTNFFGVCPQANATHNKACNAEPMQVNSSIDRVRREFRERMDARNALRAEQARMNELQIYSQQCAITYRSHMIGNNHVQIPTNQNNFQFNPNAVEFMNQHGRHTDLNSHPVGQPIYNAGQFNPNYMPHGQNTGAFQQPGFDQVSLPTGLTANYGMASSFGAAPQHVQPLPVPYGNGQQYGAQAPTYHAAGPAAMPKTAVLEQQKKQNSAAPRPSVSHNAHNAPPRGTFSNGARNMQSQQSQPTERAQAPNRPALPRGLSEDGLYVDPRVAFDPEYTKTRIVSTDQYNFELGYDQ